MQSLRLDRDDDVWLVTEDDDGNVNSRLLGHVAECGDDVPAALTGHYEELLDLWLDGQRGDYAGTVESAYSSDKFRR